MIVLIWQHAALLHRGSELPLQPLVFPFNQTKLSDSHRSLSSFWMRRRTVDLWKTGHSICGQNFVLPTDSVITTGFATSPTVSMTTILNFGRVKPRSCVLWICGQLAKTTTCPQAPQDRRRIPGVQHDHLTGFTWKRPHNYQLMPVSRLAPSISSWASIQ